MRVRNKKEQIRPNKRKTGKANGELTCPERCWSYRRGTFETVWREISLRLHSISHLDSQIWKPHFKKIVIIFLYCYSVYWLRIIIKVKVLILSNDFITSKIAERHSLGSIQWRVHNFQHSITNKVFFVVQTIPKVGSCSYRPSSVPFSIIILRRRDVTIFNHYF